MRVRPQRRFEVAAAAVVARRSARMRSLELNEDLAVDALADIADLMANTVADLGVANVSVAVVANVLDSSRVGHEGEPARSHVNVDVVESVDVVGRCLARRQFHRPDPHHVVLKQHLGPDVCTGFHNLASHYSTWNQGLISKSKMSVGTETVQHAFGRLQTQEMRLSIGAQARSMYAWGRLYPSFSRYPMAARQAWRNESVAS